MAHAPSRVTIASDELFKAENPREGSISPVPSSIPPGYPTLSPWPPALTPLPNSVSDWESEESVAPTPVPAQIFTPVPSSTLSIQQIYQRIWSATDLDQITFNEGRITFWNLQTLDHQENPQLYCTLPDAAGEYSLPTFWEEEEREVEVEEVEYQKRGKTAKPPSAYPRVHINPFPLYPGLWEHLAERLDNIRAEPIQPGVGRMHWVTSRHGVHLPRTPQIIWRIWRIGSMAW